MEQSILNQTAEHVGWLVIRFIVIILQKYVQKIQVHRRAQDRAFIWIYVVRLT